MNVQLTSTDKIPAIFTSTLQLIREKGFHGTPMSQIATESGVAIGTIYHYFASKDELICSLFGHCKQQIQSAAFRAEEENLPYALKFTNIWKNLVNFYIGHPEMLSFMEQFFSSPYVKYIYKECGSLCFQDEVSLFLEQGIADGVIKMLDVNIISAAYIGTVVSTAKRHINGHFQFDDDNLNSMVGIIWDGIKTKNKTT